jgi:hypothetical protein
MKIVSKKVFVDISSSDLMCFKHFADKMRWKIDARKFFLEYVRAVQNKKLIKN